MQILLSIGVWILVAIILLLACLFMEWLDRIEKRQLYKDLGQHFRHIEDKKTGQE